MKPLKNEDILSLDAWRSQEDNRKSQDAPLWLRSYFTERSALNVSFNSLLYGTFDRIALRECMDVCNFKDAVVKSIDVHLRKHSQTIGKALARECSDPSLENLPYIAHFEGHPCGQEGEENEYVKRVRYFMNKEITKYGFKPASLDFIYVIPLNTWKEISRARKLSNEYTEQMEKWKALMREMEPSVVRKTSLKAFPKGMQSGRVYRQTSEDVWRLHKDGDI